jgi:hypothetical protein
MTKQMPSAVRLLSALMPILCCLLVAIVRSADAAGDSATAIGAATSVDVMRYGAHADGKSDDTAAFQAALDAVAVKGGVVFAPSGNYMIATHLNIPANVALQGVWHAPPTNTHESGGTTLLAVEGAGNEAGTPFITLNTNSTLEGVIVDYPNQSMTAITPYPWCISSAGGDDEAIVNCLLVNPYQAVDFGTHSAGRHTIRGLYGQPLRRGIFVDQCYDIGRIEDVHFWTFWAWGDHPYIQTYMAENAEAFIFGRTDWEYVTNTFCFGYKIGYHFIHTPTGETNGNFSGIGADASNIAVDIEATQPYGLLITNGEFVAFADPNPTEIVVSGANRPVEAQFQNCSFWGPANQIARIAGNSYVSFENCNFREWDHSGVGLPAIAVDGGDLVVEGCNFTKPGAQLSLTGSAKSAVFAANHVTGRLSIANPANADLQIGLNTAGPAK